MRRVFCIGFLCLAFFRLAAQDDEIVRAALYLSGASQAEELDTSLLEMLEAQKGRRLRVNSPHLRGHGILSDYQVASLADYRARSGDILSWEELALVDGFSAQAVAALRPFLSLESDRAAGSTDSLRVRGEALVRGTLKNVGVKAKASGEHWRIGGAWREKDWTAFAEAGLRGHRLVLGHYNLRFGQGLAQWSGFSMSSLSSVDAFLRRPTGIAPVWSYTSGNVHLGAAYAFESRHVQAMAFGALDGLVGSHLAWLNRHGEVGATVLCDASTGRWSFSADGRLNTRGVTLAWEGAWKNGSVAGLLAGKMKAGERFTLASQLRATPSRFSGKKYGEYALALGSAFTSERRRNLAGKSGFGSSVPEHEASLTVDAALLPIPGQDPRRLQVRVYAWWQWQLASAWSFQLRFTERYRNYERPRSCVRVQAGFGQGPWMACWRTEGVYCEGLGGLTYLDFGHKHADWSCYLRLTGFLIDKWNDRIYVYERDAPGNFSVPSFYGRGGQISLMGGWKHRFGRICTLKAYLRASYMARASRDPTPFLALQLHCER